MAPGRGLMEDEAEGRRRGKAVPGCGVQALSSGWKAVVCSKARWTWQWCEWVKEWMEADSGRGWSHTRASGFPPAGSLLGLRPSPGSPASYLSPSLKSGISVVQWKTPPPLHWNWFNEFGQKEVTVEGASAASWAGAEPTGDPVPTSLPSSVCGACICLGWMTCFPWLFCYPRRRQRRTVTYQIMVMTQMEGRMPWLNRVSCWLGRFLNFEEVSLFVTIQWCFRLSGYTHVDTRIFNIPLFLKQICIYIHSANTFTGQPDTKVGS